MVMMLLFATTQGESVAVQMSSDQTAAAHKLHIVGMLAVNTACVH